MGEEVTLKEHMESLFQALGERLDTYAQSHREEHLQLSEQVKRDAATVNLRLEGMNELRQQLTSERGQFVTRDLLDTRISATNDRFEEMSKMLNIRFAELSERLSAVEQAKANLDGRISMLAMVWGGLLLLINLGLNYLLRR